MVSPGPDHLHQLLPAGAGQGAAAGHVSVDQVGPDAVDVEEAELGLQVPGLVVGLADPGVAVGEGVGDHVGLRRWELRCSRTTFNNKCCSTTASRDC